MAAALMSEGTPAVETPTERLHQYARGEATHQRALGGFARDGHGPPTSTKAVLQALRALQAKISRLERERVAALTSATELRLKLELSEAKAAEDLARSRGASERAGFERDETVRKLEEDARLARSDLRLATVARQAAEADSSKLAAELSAAKRDAAATAADFAATRRENDTLRDRLAQLEAKVVQLELRNESLEALGPQSVADDHSLLKRSVPKTTTTSVAAAAARRTKPATDLLKQRARTTAQRNTHVVRVPAPAAEKKKKKVGPPKRKKVATRSLVDNGLRTALADAIRAADDPQHIKDLTTIFRRLNNTNPVVTANKKPLLKAS